MPVTPADRNRVLLGFVLGVWSFGLLLESYLRTQPVGLPILLQLLDNAAAVTVVSVARDLQGDLEPSDINPSQVPLAALPLAACTMSYKFQSLSEWQIFTSTGS